MTDIQGKVAALVDDFRIALNIGESTGVKRGDKVVLFRVVDVTDPDTQEPLGSVSVPKIHLAVESVQEKLCVAVVTDAYYPDGQPTDLFSTITRPKVMKRVARSSGPDQRTVQIFIGEVAQIEISDDADG